jgi:hypothetical protein
MIVNYDLSTMIMIMVQACLVHPGILEKLLSYIISGTSSALASVHRAICQISTNVNKGILFLESLQPPNRFFRLHIIFIYSCNNVYSITTIPSLIRNAWQSEFASYDSKRFLATKMGQPIVLRGNMF